MHQANSKPPALSIMSEPTNIRAVGENQPLSIKHSSFVWFFALGRVKTPFFLKKKANKNFPFFSYAAAAAESLQSCPTLCDPIDGSPPGCPVPGILQARTPEWVAISFSNAWKWKVKVKLLSRVRPSATPWTAAFQAPPSMGFSRQEYWSGVPLPSLENIGLYEL